MEKYKATSENDEREGFLLRQTATTTVSRKTHKAKKSHFPVCESSAQSEKCLLFSSQFQSTASPANSSPNNVNRICS